MYICIYERVIVGEWINPSDPFLVLMAGLIQNKIDTRLDEWEKKQFKLGTQEVII